MSAREETERKMRNSGAMAPAGTPNPFKPGSAAATWWQRGHDEARAAGGGASNHKLTAILIGADSQRIEEHQLLCAGPGLAAADIRAARDFLNRRAALLGLRPSGDWGFARGEVRIWASKPAEAA